MQCEKILYLTNASREDIIPRKKLCIVRDFIHHRNYASREDFIPCKNLRITGRYSYLVRNHELPERESCIQRDISASPQHLYFLTSSEEYIGDYIANTRHKLYLIYVTRIELTSNIEENNAVSHPN